MAGAAGQDSCVPSCPSDCTPGLKVPDPFNCRQYYVCLEDCVPSDPVFDCGDGYMFDTWEDACIDETADYTCGICTPACKFTCTQGYEGLIAVRGDCQSAYLCSFDPPLMTTCNTSPNLYFDGTTCQSNETLCCDPCQVFCEAAYIETLDPTDCTAFYFCSDVGYPQAEDRYLCDEGEMFVDGHCQATTDPNDCYQPCAGTGS